MFRANTTVSTLTNLNIFLAEESQNKNGYFAMVHFCSCRIVFHDTLGQRFEVIKSLKDEAGCLYELITPFVVEFYDFCLLANPTEFFRVAIHFHAFSADHLCTPLTQLTLLKGQT